MARRLAADVGLGVGAGDRALYQGICQRRGKQADVLCVCRDLARIRFDDGSGGWCLAADLHPVPRRPPPMF